ncbi:MAG: carbon storage regulator [Pirellulaceae bacterium]|jgi:carbon storage regulator|nr:carbon storage regulator [Pirellulaceae bacterium]
MLVLSRRAGEEIMIGDNIRLIITRISGNRVTVGIAAPEKFQISRRELRAADEEAKHGATPDDTLLAVT